MSIARCFACLPREARKESRRRSASTPSTGIRKPGETSSVRSTSSGRTSTPTTWAGEGADSGGPAIRAIGFDGRPGTRLRRRPLSDSGVSARRHSCVVGLDDDVPGSRRGLADSCTPRPAGTARTIGTARRRPAPRPRSPPRILADRSAGSGRPCRRLPGARSGCRGLLLVSSAWPRSRRRRRPSPPSRLGRAAAPAPGEAGTQRRPAARTAAGMTGAFRTRAIIRRPFGPASRKKAQSNQLIMLISISRSTRRAQCREGAGPVGRAV